MEVIGANTDISATQLLLSISDWRYLHSLADWQFTSLPNEECCLIDSD